MMREDTFTLAQTERFKKKQKKSLKKKFVAQLNQMSHFHKMSPVQKKQP